MVENIVFQEASAVSEKERVVENLEALLWVTTFGLASVNDIPK